MPSLRAYVIASFLVLFSLLSITGWSWNTSRKNLSKDVQTTLNTGLAGAKDAIVNRALTYAEVLNGVTGLFNAVDVVRQEDWQRYTDNLNIDQRYPGMVAMAYSEVVPAENLQEYQDARRQDLSPTYTIRSTSTTDVLAPTKFIEPQNTQNNTAIGYDPFAEPIRRKAMETARDTGAVSITGRLILVQDTNEQPGFIMFTPVYQRDASTKTVEERRAAIKGYISAGIRSNELIESLFGKTITKDSALQIFDGTQPRKENLIYQSATYDNLVKQPGVITQTLPMELGSNKWLISANVNNNFASQTQRDQPKLILTAGIVFSFLTSGFLLILMITRARTIANEKNREVQEVKDGLISLASHQLRTPATGVKQFLGMVLEGYAGEVTGQQKTMLNKAYQSNERQLEIINQILHVSRADSGRLAINKERLDINVLIKSVLDEFRPSIRERNQRIIFKKSASKIMLMADKQYLTMVIDNLLSNASKYSKPHTAIHVDVSQNTKEIALSVSDKGVGIDERDIHKLFQKFSRIDNELSIEAGGNGIGLYLSREIVLLHGGTIDIESSPGEGSRFTVTLPKK